MHHLPLPVMTRSISDSELPRPDTKEPKAFTCKNMHSWLGTNKEAIRSRFSAEGMSPPLQARYLIFRYILQSLFVPDVNQALCDSFE
jgi:hypothetical protein